MLSIVVPTDRDSFSGGAQSAVTPDLEWVFVGMNEAPTRAERLNIGFHRTKGRVILFHHPRSIVDAQGLALLAERSREPELNVFWGGFTHRFDDPHALLRFTSWYSNRIRPRLSGVLYLDHCIFFDRRLWLRDLPAVAIFEDTLLSYEFRKNAKPEIWPFTSTTSAVRFQKNGYLRQGLINQALKVAFHLGAPAAVMNKIYERGLNLNSN